MVMMLKCMMHCIHSKSLSLSLEFQIRTHQFLMIRFKSMISDYQFFTVSLTPDRLDLQLSNLIQPVWPTNPVSISTYN